MNIFGLSDKGRYRAENQDSFDTCGIGGGVLAVVCDGMGGAAAGRMASDMAAARFTAHVRCGLEVQDPGLPTDILRKAADAANRSVYQYACENEECLGMGTTLVAGFFSGEKAVVVNVGDSRAYRIAKDGIFQISKDHSLVQQMVDRGQLTSAQALRHPKKNIITRAVGTEQFVTSDLFELNIRPQDRFLLCSDGLTNAVDEAEIHRLILAADTPESACRSLIQAALDANARDNVTAVVIFEEKGGARNG